MSGEIFTHSGRTRVAGVFGWPVSHSRSPRLHGYWLRKYGIDGAYLPFATTPEDIVEAIRALPKLGFRGANVTLPHKETAFDAVDDISPRARRIGAVNTLIVQEDGGILGDNTDGFGFLEHLQASAPSWRADAGSAVILGAGGAARAIAVALQDEGVRRVVIANRSISRAEELAKELGALEVVAWEERGAALKDAALLVNTTQLGMTGQPALEIDLGALAPEAVVDDIVYAPLETGLLAAARARGHVVVDGIGMLLHQARPGFEAWFGRAPEVDAALRDFVLAG
ncbi:shikimate dehydrogenase [Dongia mobilis]|uniref:Shikimate dehydrogenase (NADP(+)) n=1 Tax=Dongia mobilis TaxID=578943 RepID=A0A4R6WS99_9PROT|nr:shikimate dehydrogenase [Dongia mobilis]TDQ81944.1 shikimate dehydrogenase [Dongia mobilis]